jgi:hypothetical protein
MLQELLLVITEQEESNGSLRISPMPSAKRFVGMKEDDKKSVLEHALLERLAEGEDEIIVKTATAVVDKFRGQEDQLYDMISELGADAVCDMCDAGGPTMRVENPVCPPKLEVGDIIEVGGPRNGSLETVHDNSLIVKVLNTTRHTNSVHVDGIQLSVSGKEQKLCDMFLAPASIRRIQAGGRDNVVLSHPGAKIAFERRSGAAWFTCRKSYDGAMLRAT